MVKDHLKKNLLLNEKCKMKNEDDKYYSQIYFAECKSRERKIKKKYMKKSNS